MADIVLTGNTSGAITIAAPAVAGTNTLTLPASTGTVVTDTAPAVGGIIQVVNKVISTQGSQTIATTDTQTASNKLGLSMATQTYGGTVDDATTPEIMNLQTVDSTGSTIATAITYTLVAASGLSPTMWTNRTFGGAGEYGVSELMIMEVAQ